MNSSVSISARTLWSVAGLIVLLAAAYVVVTGATSELLLLFGAIVIAEGIRPLVERMVALRVPKALATLLILIVIVGVIGGLGYLVLQPVSVQIAQLADELPQLTVRAQHTIGHYRDLFHANPAIGAVFAGAPARFGAFLTGKISTVVLAPVYAASAISNVFLLLLLTFFWLMATPELSAFCMSLVPGKHRVTARSIFDELSRKNGGYLRGVFINMMVIGLLSGAGLAILKVPYTVLLGVVAGLTEAIPVVGPLIGGAAAVAVAGFAVGPAKALQVAALYVVIQQVEGNTLVPLVMNRAVELNPLAIIVTLLIGSALLGVPGAVLAVPAAATLQILLVRIAAPVLRAKAGRSEQNPT